MVRAPARARPSLPSPTRGDRGGALAWRRRRCARGDRSRALRLQLERGAAPLRRRRFELGDELQPGACQPVEMPRRPARLGTSLPARFEETAVGEPHQNWIHGAGFEVELLTEIITIPPFARLTRERAQDSDGLGGWASRAHRYLKSI